MKKFITASAAVLVFGLTVFAQDLSYRKKWYTSESTTGNGSSRDLMYEVRGRYDRSVKEEKLNEARSLRDFIPGYPVNWVTQYVSVELLTTCNGKAMKAVSANDVLSSEQINMLKTADLATTITVNVKYKYRNPVTDAMEDYTMHVSMMVIPEVEAEYVGGYRQMAKYLNETVIDKITKTTPREFQKGVVVFTVDEDGEAVNVKIATTSGDSKTDKLLLESINKMPKWIPAKNSKGIKVKQEFEFSVGNDGC